MKLRFLRYKLLLPLFFYRLIETDDIKLMKLQNVESVLQTGKNIIVEWILHIEKTNGSSYCLKIKQKCKNIYLRSYMSYPDSN